MKILVRLSPIFAIAGLLACPYLDDDVDAAEQQGDGVTSIDKAGKKHVVNGYTPMKAAPNSKKFQAPPKMADKPLPKKVDLRKDMTKIENQGETSSCVANALAGSYEYWVKRTTSTDFDVSRLFMYYNARWRAGDQNKDGGSVIQLAMEGLQEFGACPENTWPFDASIVLKKPDRDAYKEASEQKVKEMQQVPLDLTAWKQALASGYPIVFGCLLFDSFDQCNHNGGVVPMPSPQDVGRAEHAGHAMCCVGYSDKEQVFIIRNSWGEEWGDKGYCYMPYNYLMNPDFNGGDSWVFIPEKPIENPEDTWYEDEEPVTDGGKGVTYVINTYDVDDYDSVETEYWEQEEEYEEDAPDDYDQYVTYEEHEDWQDMEDTDSGASDEVDNDNADDQPDDDAVSNDDDADAADEEVASDDDQPGDDDSPDDDSGGEDDSGGDDGGGGDE